MKAKSCVSIKNIVSRTQRRQRPPILTTSSFHPGHLFERTRSRSVTHTRTHVNILIRGHLIACTLLVYSRSRRDEPRSLPPKHVCDGVFILRPHLAPSATFHLRHFQLFFKRGSGSTGLPRIRISHKAERRATVTLSDLWAAGRRARGSTARSRLEEYINPAF